MCTLVHSTNTHINDKMWLKPYINILLKFSVFKETLQRMKNDVNCGMADDDGEDDDAS